MNRRADTDTPQIGRDDDASASSPNGRNAPGASVSARDGTLTELGPPPPPPLGYIAENEIPGALERITEEVVSTYSPCGVINHLNQIPLPSTQVIREILDDFHEILYPGYGKRKSLNVGNIKYYVGDLLHHLFDRLREQIARAYRHDCSVNLEKSQRNFEDESAQLALGFLNHLPQLRAILREDVRAAYDGDPAARSLDEIIFCYPGLYAITVQRIAHVLFLMRVPLIPRIMTECAHSQTGIDIHPGASIGRGFFIDHGTGVVIGETSLIGNYVKIYQGVTLGALSFPRDEITGQLIRNSKRHPTIEDQVVIYANATILGGNTTIGRNSVIGSSVWITKSVPPRTTVTLPTPPLNLRSPGDIDVETRGLGGPLDYQI